METKKVLAIIFSLVFFVAFAFILTWGIINYNKVKDAMSGTQIYDSSDLDSAYQDGYDTALENKAEYDELINSYRDTITTLTDEVARLNSKVISLTNDKNDYATRVSNLTNDKEQLQTQVDSLNATKTENEETITSLNVKITEKEAEIERLTTISSAQQITIDELNEIIVDLQTQIEILLLSESDKSEEIALLETQLSNKQTELTIMTNNYNNCVGQIASLNSYVLNLQTLNAQLQSTNEANAQVIISLNAKIKLLNSQISELNFQILTNTNSTSLLQKKITQLQESVTYYESYISQLESGTQVVATFEFDGSVVAIQIVNTNSMVSISDPLNTENAIFNYWTVNDERVDLNAYVLSSNIKFVANVTYQYKVNFLVDEEIFSTKTVISGNVATISTSPLKTNYVFDGWSVDGVNVIDISSYAITQNITFFAVFTQTFSVSFIYEDEIISTQTVRNGLQATNIDIESTAYKNFNGWKTNDMAVEVESYVINFDTIFVADITYSYDIVFMANDEIFDSQIVVNGNYASSPAAPSKPNFEFDGWSIDGVNIVNITTNVVSSNVTYFAKFTQLFTVTFINESETISTQTIRNGEYANNVNVESTTYKIFNGWTFDGIIVDVNSFVINSDTSFLADFTNAYAVTFSINNKTYATQIIVSGLCANIPTEPIVSNYEFMGWSLDGTIVVNISENIVTNDIVYYGVFEAIHTANGTFRASSSDSPVYTQWVMSVLSGKVTYTGTSLARFKNKNVSSWTDDYASGNLILTEWPNAENTPYRYILNYDSENDIWVHSLYKTIDGEYVLSRSYNLYRVFVY